MTVKIETGRPCLMATQVQVKVTLISTSLAG